MSDSEPSPSIEELTAKARAAIRAQFPGTGEGQPSPARFDPARASLSELRDALDAPGGISASESLIPEGLRGLTAAERAAEYKKQQREAGSAPPPRNPLPPADVAGLTSAERAAHYKARLRASGFSPLSPPVVDSTPSRADQPDFGMTGSSPAQEPLPVGVAERLRGGREGGRGRRWAEARMRAGRDFLESSAEAAGGLIEGITRRSPSQEQMDSFFKSASSHISKIKILGQPLTDFLIGMGSGGVLRAAAGFGIDIAAVGATAGGSVLAGAIVGGGLAYLREYVRLRREHYQDDEARSTVAKLVGDIGKLWAVNRENKARLARAAARGMIIGAAGGALFSIISEQFQTASSTPDSSVNAASNQADTSLGSGTEVGVAPQPTATAQPISTPTTTPAVASSGAETGATTPPSPAAPAPTATPVTAAPDNRLPGGLFVTDKVLIDDTMAGGPAPLTGNQPAFSVGGPPPSVPPPEAVVPVPDAGISAGPVESLDTSGLEGLGSEVNQIVFERGETAWGRITEYLGSELGRDPSVGEIRGAVEAFFADNPRLEATNIPVGQEFSLGGVNEYIEDILGGEPALPLSLELAPEHVSLQSGSSVTQMAQRWLESMGIEPNGTMINEVAKQVCLDSNIRVDTPGWEINLHLPDTDLDTRLLPGRDLNFNGAKLVVDRLLNN